LLTLSRHDESKLRPKDSFGVELGTKLARIPKTHQQNLKAGLISFPAPQSIAYSIPPRLATLPPTVTTYDITLDRLYLHPY